MSTGEHGHQTFDEFSREQLEIYARELAEHVQRERGLRQDMEYRVRELEALNKLFQQHLEERFRVVDAYRDLTHGLQRLAEEMNALAERASTEIIPEREDILGDSALPGQTDP